VNRVELTPHPFQRFGAHAAAVLRGRAHPGDLTAADIDALAGRVISDAVTAAMAPKNGAGWAWLQRLAMAFPNSPATHPRRAKWDAEEVRCRLEAIFAADDDPAGPCVWCGRPAGQRWGRSLAPLTDSGNYVNVQPPGGHLYCRHCRVALWCMPYAAGYGYRGLRTVTAADEALERHIVGAMVTANLPVIEEHWAQWPRIELGDAILDALASGPGDLEVQTWKNANREAWLNIRYLTAADARWLAQVRTDPQAWQALTALLADTHPVNYLLADLAPGRPHGQLVHAVAAEALAVIETTGELPSMALLELATSWVDAQTAA
jgi:CRISPR-associated protein Cst1